MLGLPEDTELDATRKAELNALNEPPQPESVHLRLEYQQDVALYRYIYDFVQENRAIWQQGIVITRDWEPTIPVVRGDEQEGEKRIGGIPEHAFWRGKALKEKVLLPVSCASDIAAYCTWVFDTFNDEFHQPQRVPVGGKQGRTLKEALTEAGYSAGSIQSEAASSSDGNKSKPQYAVGFPLILLLGSEVPERVFKDDNLGLSYQRHFVSPIGRRPPPLLRTRQVELSKNKGQMILPLYWFEPADGS
jgi:CRISPR-associated endonuclease/helicase Cas3